MGLFDDVMMYSENIGRGIISGIVTGTVKENYNKDYPGQVRVELFLGEKGRNVTGWVSVMSPYAGADHGFYTLPEVGSEVVVAFNMGDRNRPVVIGSLWSDKNKFPKEAVTEKNTSKQFITKGGNEIIIDDTQDKQKIIVKTKNGSGIEIDEEKKHIIIHDKDKKNSIEMDSGNGAITITADKKIILKAGGSEVGTFDGTGKKVELKSASVSLDASKDLKLKGQTTSLEGTSVKVNGTSSLQVSSSGTTQVKGTMVKIN